MGFRKLLSQLGDLVPAGARKLDDVAEESLPAIRRSTIPTEVGPEVIGTGTSRAAREAGEEIPDAVFREITPTTGMDDMSFLGRMDPRLAKLIGGGALVGGAGLAMMGGEDEPPQIPFAPKAQLPVEPEKILPDNYNELAQEEALNQPIVPEVSQAPLSQRMEPSAPVMEETPTNYLELLKQAQEARKQSEVGSLFAQAGADIAAGFGAGSGLRDKPDYSTAEWLTKRGERGVADVKQQMETDISEKKMQQMQREMNDEQSLRDSKSDISKTARDIAKNLGINVSDSTSAKQLQDAGLPLGTLLSTKMAADSRREMAQLAKVQKATKTEKDLSQQQRKFTQGLRKELTSGVLGKQYATFSTGQRMSSALQKFAENPTGYSDYATLMGGLKVLQGDESVVREAEVRLGMAATSLFESLQNDLQRLQSGKSLQPSQRKAMIDTIQTLTDLSRQQYMQAAAPILEQAEMEGIPASVLLSGSLSGAKEEAKPSESQPLTTGTVTIRRKSDGATKVMSADKATKMDKTKYEIVK